MIVQLPDEEVALAVMTEQSHSDKACAYLIGSI